MTATLSDNLTYIVGQDASSRGIPNPSSGLRRLSACHLPEEFLPMGMVILLIDLIGRNKQIVEVVLIYYDWLNRKICACRRLLRHEPHTSMVV